MTVAFQLVDELTNRVMLLEVQNRQPPCCQTCQDNKHQLILLQNEMALMKANVSFKDIMTIEL